MANAFVNTGTGSFGNSSAPGTYGTAGLLQRAYDKVLDFKLRSEPMFRSLADKKPGSLTNNSNQVLFQIYQDLAVTDAALSESSDPDTIGMSTPDYVAVTMAEYGKMVARTKALKLFSFTDVDPAIANIVAYNMIDTIDSMVNEVLIGGDNVIYSGDATATDEVTAADTLSSAEIRKAITKLRAGKAVPRKGSLYAVYLHPEVSHDLRAETGAASWRLPHEYQTNQNLWAGEIGQWEGGYFVETPRAYTAEDGDTDAKVYRTIVAGREALAEAVAEEPHTVIAPVTDNFQRFHKVGWYAALGWNLYRQEALYRIESGSSVA